MALYRCTGKNDTWPDMTGASQLNLRTERFSSVEINQVKKIDNVIYIHLKGVINFTVSSGLLAYRLAEVPSVIITGNNYKLETKEEYPLYSTMPFYAIGIGQGFAINILCENGTVNNVPIDLKFILTPV